MQAIKFHITTLSPLLIAANTGDSNMVGTLDYIPATALRGLFACEFIKKQKLGNDAHKDETFKNWFLRGSLKFTNAYITSTDKYGKIKTNYPIPMSIQKEKRGDKLYDLMFQDEEFDKQTKVIDGYGRFEDNRLYKEAVKTSLNFHHARDRERGVAKEGYFFNYESINEGQIFEGLIIGSKEDLNEFLNTFSNGIYYVGRSRNSQYGKIVLKFLDKKLQDFIAETGIKTEEIQAGEISLTLLSDTIIYNENGFPVTDSCEIEKVIGCNIKKSFIKTEHEESFISVWRLKTPSTTCFKAGSCFLIEVKNDDIERLLELQKKGIGERTNEGFGRFVLGWQKKEDDIYEHTGNSTTLQKPLQPIPEITKNIVIKIIQDTLSENIRGKAINAVKDAKKLPTTSLVGKLELIVRKLNSSNEFKNNLKNLKNIAVEKLKSCRINNETLYQHLENFAIDTEIGNIIRNKKDLEDLCNEVFYVPINDSSLKSQLYKEYLQTLFSIMRKKAKQEGK